MISLAERGLARILLYALTILSLLLLAATVGLWVRSYRVGDNLRWHVRVEVDGGFGEREYDLRSAAGGMAMAVSTRTATSERGVTALRDGRKLWKISGWSTYRPTSRPTWWLGPPTFWDRLGFEYRHNDDPNRYWDYEDHFRAVSSPCWFLALVTAPLPAAGLARAVRRCRACRSQARGLCPSCGYDLRATPDRCPECGTIPLR